MQSSNCVAIIMATYNGEKYISKQLDSIINQAYKNIKIYINDDCSTDNTYNILKQYQKKYPYLINIKQNKNNIGFIKNFETLIKNCNEGFIALSDQDDIWDKNKLSRQMEIILKDDFQNTPLMIHHDLKIIDEFDNLYKRSYFKYKNYHFISDKNLGQILGPCGVMGNTILLNKKLKEIILPFPNTLDYHDYWIAINCELFGKRYTIKEQLINYRFHNNNTSNNKKDNSNPNNNAHLLRLSYLKELHKKIQIQSDIKTLNSYIDYLENKKNIIIILYNAIKFKLLKKGLLNIIKALNKLIIKRINNETHI